LWNEQVGESAVSDWLLQYGDLFHPKLMENVFREATGILSEITCAGG